MAIALRVRGDVQALTERLVARIATAEPGAGARPDTALLLCEGAPCPADIDRYAAVIGSAAQLTRVEASAATPLVRVAITEHLKEGYIVVIEPRTGSVQTLFRPESAHNTIFTTERCNSNCLMCSQPPKDVDDSFRVKEWLRVISLIRNAPSFYCITGGEPTLLGEGLIEILTALKERLPSTHVQMLTNGRAYRNASVTRAVAGVGHPWLFSCVPLYADVAGIHDYIVQAPGAFDETVEGLYNAAEAKLAVEIRVVLHKQSLPRLLPLCEFIYKNFPFVAHVALMGLEHMGYVKKNWDTLWIDPFDYRQTLREAVRFLHLRGMNVSVYNLQLCLLPRDLWSFARKSISDFKNIYLNECTSCLEREHCCGLFASQLHRHSAHIRPFLLAAIEAPARQVIPPTSI